MTANPRYIKDKKGKFAGSVGEGKTKIPAAMPHGYTPIETAGRAPLRTAFARYLSIKEGSGEDPEVEDTMSNEDVMVLFNLNRGSSGDNREDLITGYRLVCDSLATNQQIFLADQMPSMVKYDLACETFTPPAVLEHLSHRDGLDTRMAVAANPSTPTDLIVRMVEADLDDDDSCGDICASAAGNPSTPLHILAYFTGHEADQVQLALANNPSATPEILDSMCMHFDPEIREAVARNTTSSDTLEFMAEDSIAHPNVIERVAANPYTPANKLTELSKHPDEFVQSEVAGNISTPPTALDALSRSPFARVQDQVVRNPNTPLVTLAHLSDMCLTPGIRRDAEEQLERIAELHPDLVEKAYATSRGNHE